MSELDDKLNSLVSNIVMYDVGIEKKRIGRFGDGGYVVLPNVCKIAPALYSYGVGDDISFEIEFSQLWPTTSLYLFDPNVDKLPAIVPCEFFQAPLTRSLMLYTYREANAILKFDVEWSEWDGLLALPDECWLMYSQIIAEFHLFFVPQPTKLSSYFTGLYHRVNKDSLDETDRNVRLADRYCSVLRDIATHFWCYHIHANNSLGLMRVGDYLIPPLLEMSFVRKDLVEGAYQYKGVLPVTGLDVPNKADRPDIVDWYPIRRVSDVE